VLARNPKNTSLSAPHTKQGTIKNAQLKKVNSQLGKKEIMWVVGRATDID
jgi:hypothetical protein